MKNSPKNILLLLLILSLTASCAGREIQKEQASFSHQDSYNSSNTDHDELNTYIVYQNKESTPPRKEVRYEPSAEILYKTGWSYYRSGDFATAVSRFQLAAEQGHVASQNILGHILSNEKSVRDLKKARDWYTKAAEQGHASSQNNLAVMLVKGEGGKKDRKGAVSWYTKAAEQGDKTARRNLGYCFLNGNGVKKDYVKARHWLQLAAEQGDNDARKGLTIIDREESTKQKEITPPTKIKKVKKSKKRIDEPQDNGEAAFASALSHLNGKGVPQDYGKAMELFRDADHSGNTSAAYYMGMMYEKGLGVAKDLKIAYNWYSRAAEKGDAMASERMKVLLGR